MGPEQRVGVRVQRTGEMVAVLLGVLRSGGAYVPLDPQYPEERLGWMVGDSGARVVVSEEGWAGPAGLIWPLAS